MWVFTTRRETIERPKTFAASLVCFSFVPFVVRF
jgi:hypothetical protein